MRNSQSLRQVSGPALRKFSIGAVGVPRHFLLGVILIFALVAFEAFNFDTTRYALHDLLGDVTFAGIAWATILAIAFCAIDFAGLGRLLTPERGGDEPKEIWYLTGAWLLGATMNAVMTWWAVSTVLLSHELGNEVLGREQLLHIVPVFVAVLVWLTRILFIGAVTMAGERLLHGDSRPGQTPVAASPQPQRSAGNRQASYATQPVAAPQGPKPAPIELGASGPAAQGSAQANRIGQRPPRPGSKTTRRHAPAGMQASDRRSR